MVYPWGGTVLVLLVLASFGSGGHAHETAGVAAGHLRAVEEAAKVHGDEAAVEASEEAAGGDVEEKKAKAPAEEAAEHGEGMHSEGEHVEEGELAEGPSGEAAEHGEGVHSEGEHMEGGEHAEEGEEEEEEEEEFTLLDLNAGVLLLSGVSFVMIVLAMVNIADDDVRRYAWRVISNTISIFMAVLFFQGNNQILVNYLRIHKYADLSVVIAQYFHCSGYIVAMLLAVGYHSGVFEQRVDLNKKVWTWADAMLVNFEQEVDPKLVRAVVRGDPESVSKSVATDAFGLEVPVEKKALEKESRWRRNKAFSTLLAHMGGFAAIAAGGAMQQHHPFRSNAFLAMLPVLITIGVLLALFQLTQLLRHKLRQDAKDAGGKGARAAMVHEITMEAENDILALAISFNTVQAVRFAIMGELPNAEGLYEHITPTRFDYFMLFGAGLVFITLSITLAVVIKSVISSEEKHGHGRHKKAEGQEEEEEEHMSFVHRFLEILMAAFAMCSAWCTLFGARNVWMLSPHMPATVVSINGRILLAAMLSMFGFVIVFLLDKVNDFLKRGGGASTKAAESAVASIVGGVSVLVGFSWEHSFDGAVAAVASLSEEHAQGIKFFLGLAVFVGLLVPWRRYILKRSLQLDELKRRRAASTAMARQHGNDQSRPFLQH